MKKVMNAIKKAAKQFSATILDNFQFQNSDIIVQTKNIYNAKSKIRRKKLDKYTFIQTLLRVLYKNNWFVKFLLKKNSKKINKRQ